MWPNQIFSLNSSHSILASSALLGAISLCNLLFSNHSQLSSWGWSLDLFLWGSVAGYTVSVIRWLQLPDNRIKWQPLFRLALLLGSVLLVAVPFHSTDLYGYINRGAQQIYYGMNPTLHPLSHLPHWLSDPIFTAHWVDNPSPYGPVFNLMAAGVVALSGHQLWVAFLGFKLLNLVLYLTVGIFLYQLAQCRQTHHPSNHEQDLSPLFLTALFWLNPLVMVHVLANGHNDLWIPFGILGAWLLLSRPRWSWLSMPVLGLSIGIKFASIIAAPFILVRLWQLQDWRGLALGLLISGVGTFGILWMYFGADWQNLPWQAMMENAGMAQHSLNAMLSRMVFYLGKLIPALSSWFEPIRSGLKPVFWTLFAVFYSILLIQFCRLSSPSNRAALSAWHRVEPLIGPTTLLLTIMITVVSAKFHPWYLMMILPLMLLIPQRHWMFRFGMWLSLFQLLALTPLQNIHMVNYVVLTLLPLGLALGRLPGSLLKQWQEKLNHKLNQWLSPYIKP